MMHIVYGRSMLFCAFVFVIGALGIYAQTGDDPAYARYLKLTKSAPEAYVAGNRSEAAEQAKSLLAMVHIYRRDWNYGNAVHAAHLVLGRIAADSGQMNEARRHFFESVTSLPYAFDDTITKTQPWEEPFPKLPYKASPQMDTFGPDMSFARFLLEKGEKEMVLKYLDHCERFWTMGVDQLTLWRQQINAGEIPNFGPNMIYFFPKATSNDR